jgi:MFS family permease
MHSRHYKRYLLLLLLFILGFNFADRTALGLVLDDIKTDLSLTDTQLGFLSGIAFAVFYSIMGIPIARWADRGNRVLIIGLTTAVWSAAVALCGIVGNYLQLLLARIAVGVGEAGCVPPANSLIADFFSRAERPRAVAMYMQGIPASLLIGYFVSGWLSQFYGWRTMFVLIGLPGLVLAAVAWLSMKEPRRSSAGRGAKVWRAQASFKEVCATLWVNRTFRHLLYAYSVFFFFSYGGFQWTPAFFVRSFGLKTGELGTWLAVVYGVGSIVGTYWIGEWASRRAPHDERRQLRGLALLLVVSGILGALVYIPHFAPDRYWAFVWLGLSTLAGMINGPAFAAIQTLVPERMRATAVALVYLFANLIGLGFGPWVVGALSDFLRPWQGAESLRYALLTLSPGYFWVSWHLWKASTTVSADLNTLRGASESGIPQEA